MKKEIMNLLNSENGSFRINNISKLERWTKDGIGNDVDMLIIRFDPVNGVNFGDDTVRIDSRDFDGIIADCRRAINNHMNTVTNKLLEQLQNGYINC